MTKGLEELAEALDPGSEYYSFTLMQSNNVYHMDLGDSIGGKVLDYTELFNSLNRVTENDVVRLVISNCGGDVMVGQRIVEALKHCKGHVHAHVINNASSMAAIIALACDSLTLSPGSYLMFHNYSGMSFGKGQEMMHGLANLERSIQTLEEVYCRPFLTKGELTKISKDQDIYVHDTDNDLQTRCERHFKAMR